MADRYIENNSCALIFVEKADGSTNIEILYPKGYDPSNPPDQDPQAVVLAHMAKDLVLDGIALLADEVSE